MTVTRKADIKYSFLLLGLTVLLFLSGCGIDAAESPRCPSIGDDITWNPISAYGDFRIDNEGDDSSAARIAQECGWHTLSMSGFESTYSIASPDYEVIFTWADNSFSWFTVFEEWRGQTHEGIIMGDSKSSFLAAHRGFQPYVDESCYIYEPICPKYLAVLAYFDNDDRLTQLEIIGSCR